MAEVDVRHRRRILVLVARSGFALRSATHAGPVASDQVGGHPLARLDDVLAAVGDFR